MILSSRKSVSLHQFSISNLQYSISNLIPRFNAVTITRSNAPTLRRFSLIQSTFQVSRFTSLLLCALAFNSHAAAAPSPDPATLPAPKRAVIPKLNGPVTIDGDLNEPVWAKAAVLEPFYQNDGSGPEREHTSVRLWYDDEAIYLGWLCRDSDIQATFTNRDSHFWDEEVVEFFVTPKPLDHYFELQWNPLGGVFDAIITNDLDAHGVSKAFHGDWLFTASSMTSAVKLKGTPNNHSDKDEFWQVEVRVPFADLHQPAPKPGDLWRGNFYRFNRTRDLPVEELSWSPALLPGFHQPTRFGFLEFGR